MSFISLFEIISVFILEPCIFFKIPVSIADSAVTIPNGANILTANGIATLDHLLYLIMLLKNQQIELFQIRVP